MESGNNNARTSGDGMENVTSKKENIEIKAFKISNKDLTEIPKNISIPANENKSKKLFVKPGCFTNDKLPIPGLHTIYRTPTRIILAPNMPIANLVLYETKLVKTVDKPEHKKVKPPKFIPFEPYKACISFLTKEEKAKSLVKIKKHNKNNLDINILVSQLKHNEEKEILGPTALAESEMKKLKDENDGLKRQLKIQVQVNTELKNLLVAAVGEDDLHTKVNILTEDKIELARAYNLSSQTEQIEYLVGQCEVWRSKFLATRIIIEELAQYKNDLNDKNNILCDTNKGMLELIGQIREMLIEVLKNIKFLANLKKINLNSADIISLTSECLNITQQMVLHYSGIGSPNTNNDLITTTSNVLTEIEKAAYKALERINPTYLINPDENFKAILKQANRKLSISQDKPENTHINNTE